MVFMLLSYNWLKELIEFDYTPAELAEKLTMLGIEVEEITDFGKKYDGFITAEVKEREKHPDADKLSLCKVFTGSETLDIVCGAPNVAAGQKVILGQIGAVVPVGDFELKKAKIRGAESYGMICSETELDFGDDGSGIMVLPDDTEIGRPIAEYLKLNDTIIEVFVTPNRSDCNSHIGIAREIAALTGKNINIPGTDIVENDNDINESIKVEINAPDKCPRYTARMVRNAQIKESPQWLKQRLTMLGLRPINNVVDVTNYVLMEMGQPLHAFDYDLVAGKKIIVQTVADKTKFTTLDEKERELDSEMLMICDAEKPVAVGGVMGGMNSEINDNTKNILIESAYFNPSSVRRTAKKLGINSDSSYRFERGVDYNNILNALNRAAKLIAELTGGVIEKGYIDEYPNPQAESSIALRFDRARKVIGIDISNEKIVEYLEKLNFKIIEKDDKSVVVLHPSYRVDMEQEIDLIEEIARMYNYNDITPDFSSRIDFSSEGLPKHLSVPPQKEKVSNYLVSNGFDEIITQNMLDPKTSVFFTDEPVTLANPLGEELSIMRSSVIPSIMKVVRYNLRMGNKNLKLFEIGKTFHKVNENVQTPVKGYLENEELTIAMTGLTVPKQWGEQSAKADFYDIKGVVQNIFEYLKIEGIKFKPSKQESKAFGKNSIGIFFKKNQLGIVGEVDAKLLKHYDIEDNVFIANIDLSKVYEIEVPERKYKKVPPYPSMERDLSFVFSGDFEAEKIYNVIEQSAGKYLTDIQIFDVYKGKNLGGKTSIGFTMHYSSPERTLTDKEVDQSINKIIKNVESKFECELRK
jgi:phenylalanyl-tRNA synthetase beta chain